MGSPALGAGLMVAGCSDTLGVGVVCSHPPKLTAQTLMAKGLVPGYSEIRVCR